MLDLEASLLALILTKTCLAELYSKRLETLLIKFQSVELINLYNYTKSLTVILKGDSMVRHHIGLNRMHPDRSSCLNFSVNGSNGLTD